MIKTVDRELEFKIKINWQTSYHQSKLQLNIPYKLNKALFMTLNTERFKTLCFSENCVLKYRMLFQRNKRFLFIKFFRASKKKCKSFFGRFFRSFGRIVKNTTKFYDEMCSLSKCRVQQIFQSKFENKQFGHSIDPVSTQNFKSHVYSVVSIFNEKYC